MSRELGRRFFDALEARLVPLVSRRPALAFDLAAAIGAARRRLSGQWPSVQEVALLFATLPRNEARSVAAHVARNESRNRLWNSCVRRAGLAPLRGYVVAEESFASLRPPLILATWHVGAWDSLGPALERLGGPVLVLRDSEPYPHEPPVQVALTRGDEQRRAATLARGLVVLGAGGFVVVTLDFPPAAGPRTPCFGRALELAPGPFVLARRSGASIVPVWAGWRPRRIAVRAGAPWTVPGVGRIRQPAVGANLPGSPGTATHSAPVGDSRAQAPRFEAELAACAGSWLERTLLESPRDMGLGLLRELLSSPVAEGRSEPLPPTRAVPR